MSVDNRPPKEGFRSFLEKAEEDGWIASYKWASSDSYVLLKDKLGEKRDPLISRTHKRGTDGVFWACEVEAHDGTMVGVDLEILIERPILTRPHWLQNRLNITKATTPKTLLEEWSAREAAFKAMSPDNAGMRLSQFRKNGPHSYEILAPQGEKNVQLRHMWMGRWLLSLAWRSLN